MDHAFEKEDPISPASGPYFAESNGYRLFESNFRSKVSDMFSENVTHRTSYPYDNSPADIFVSEISHHDFSKTEQRFTPFSDELQFKSQKTSSSTIL